MKLAFDALMKQQAVPVRFEYRVAVVIPCYRAANTLKSVVERIPDSVSQIICVEDCSDDGTLDVIRELANKDPRITLVSHARNMGVGGATVSGYRRALSAGVDIIVKLDSDGQMDPALIPALITPLVEGDADYTKGNRFFDISSVRSMPWVRLVGNAGLSFVAKLTTGYWNLFDPTNGFTAIHSSVCNILPLEKLNDRYFFESDMLFRLSTVRARIVEVPMNASYGNEVSNLSVRGALLSFPWLSLRNLVKRIAYNYFLRGFSAASLSLLVGLTLFIFGLVFGFDAWTDSARSGTPATAGTVMLSALPLLLGFQLVLHFLHLDVGTVPDRPIHRSVERLTALHPVQ